MSTSYNKEPECVTGNSSCYLFLSSWLIPEHIQKMKALLYHLLTPVPALRRWIYPTARLLSSA